MSNFANKEDPDEMQHYVHFVRVYTVCKGKKTSDKRIKYF